MQIGILACLQVVGIGFGTVFLALAGICLLIKLMSFIVSRLGK